MRIIIPSMEHAKRVSKRLQAALKPLCDPALSTCQTAIARALGYNDWHELEQVTAQPDRQISVPDRQVSFDTGHARRQFQAVKIVSTPAIKLEMVHLFKVRDIVDAVQPSDFDRQVASPSLAAKLFPPNWEDAPPANAQEDDMARYFELATLGIVSRCRVVAELKDVDPSLSRSVVPSRHGDALRLVAMYCQTEPDAESSFDALAGISIDARERDGFIDHLTIAVELAFFAPGCSSPGHVQHLAWHVRRYLDQPALHPAFESDLTAHPGGLDVELILASSDTDARRLARALREAFKHDLEMQRDGGFLTDQFLSEHATDFLFVRRFTFEDQRDDDEATASSDELTSPMNKFVDAMVARTAADHDTAGRMPQTLAAYYRGKGNYTVATRFAPLFKMDLRSAARALGSISDSLILEGAIDPDEAAFMGDWALSYGESEQMDIAEYDALEDDSLPDNERDQMYAASLRKVGASWLAEVFLDDEDRHRELVAAGRKRILGLAQEFPG